MGFQKGQTKNGFKSSPGEKVAESNDTVVRKLNYSTRTTMEEFLKSVLPGLDYRKRPDSDTTLALPSEPSVRSSDWLTSDDRSLRVQQQVQLTLARKAKRSSSNGSVHLQRSFARSFDAADGPKHGTTVNGYGWTFSKNERLRRPSRRVEVSPPETPDTAGRHFVFNGRPAGACTLPVRSVSQRNCSLLGRSLGWHQRHGVIESPRGGPAHTSTPAANGGSCVWSDRSFGLRRHNSAWNGPAFPQSEGMVAAPRFLQRLLRLNTYPPSSVDGAAVDSGRAASQLIRTNDVVALLDKPPEMKLERAVNLLTDQNEETLIRAAAQVQSQCFKSADARKMVYYMRGIKKLLHLLHNDEEEVQRAAAAALRNVVYQSSDNKMEVKDHGGLATILRVLKNSRDTETRRQLAGLLWNLSSHDLLKENLSREALDVLTQSVLVPSSGISEGENPKDELLADDEVFHNATSCLRNLSSSGPDGRKAMRDCENLIDSLVYFIRRTVSDYKADDKSTENCVCILHNLSYQIESELPTCDLLPSQEVAVRDPVTLGCFSPRAVKTKEVPRHRTPLEEKANPRGIEWLWSSITIRMYLSLIARSARHCTREAAVGALQNITAGNGAVTEAIAYVVVRKENGLQHVRKMLQDGERDVKRTAVSLVKNLSRFSELHSDIVTQVLPEVVELLPNDDTGRDVPSDVTASLCHVLLNLTRNDVHCVRAMLSQDALPKICNISKEDNGYGPSRAGVMACFLLHSMWEHTDLHGTYKKCGFRKADFINPRTTKAVNSL
ncbi:plakophilin-2 isoform X2 [Stigmatopora argus]